MCIRDRPHPHSAPAWELPYERITELPKPYRGSDAELPLPPFLLSQMDRRLLPVHDEAVLYPYRVLSCLSADSSVAEYFTRKEELAAERGDGRDADVYKRQKPCYIKGEIRSE